MGLGKALWFNNGDREEPVASNQADTTSQVQGNTEVKWAIDAQCLPIRAWSPAKWGFKFLSKAIVSFYASCAISSDEQWLLKLTI